MRLATFATRRRVRRGVFGLLIAGLILAPLHGVSAGAAGRGPGKPTIVLVHGAWADAASWSRVVRQLQDDGYSAVAVPNPLRSLAGDSAYVAEYLRSIKGPVVLVGHSYGGAVITNAAHGNPNVRALVYIDGFAPAEGESVTPLAGQDSALAVSDPASVFSFVPANLPPSPATDLYLKTETFVADFANGLSRDQALVLAASQRPATLGALSEPSGPPAWRTIPSWYLIGTLDRIITPTAQRSMAERAGARIVDVRAGHLGLLSDPNAVTRVVENAATAER
jgi:pimeloyl-ACP methyl ester carboxylesterase